MSSSNNNTTYKKTSFLAGINSEFINEFYADYLSDPSSLPESWKKFFDGLSDDEKLIFDDLKGPSWSPEKKLKRIKISKDETKEVGENIELDETIIEIATDKVDSEVPSTHEGKLIEKLFEIDDLVQVGQPFAIIEVDSDNSVEEISSKKTVSNDNTLKKEDIKIDDAIKKIKTVITNEGNRFYSPLVRSMASKENIDIKELENIPGTGKDGRVSKSDMITYLNNRTDTQINTETTDHVTKITSQKITEVKKEEPKRKPSTHIPNTGGTEIIEMDRMRKLISTHMTMSKSIFLDKQMDY